MLPDCVPNLLFRLLEHPTREWLNEAAEASLIIHLGPVMKVALSKREIHQV